MDLEHFAYDMGLIRQMIVAADASDITPVIRVPNSGSTDLLPLLEAGAQGIQLPHVNLDQAKEAVQHMRYAPMGERGALGFSRAARYGEVDWEDHVHRANENLVLVASIEDYRTLDQLPDIAGLSGVDAVTIGAHDLAESMGIRELDHPKVRDAISNAASTIGNLNKAKLALSVGNSAYRLSPSDAAEMKVRYLTILPSLERKLLSMMKDEVAGLRRDIVSAGSTEG